MTQLGPVAASYGFDCCCTELVVADTQELQLWPTLDQTAVPKSANCSADHCEHLCIVCGWPHASVLRSYVQDRDVMTFIPISTEREILRMCVGASHQ